MGNSEIAIQDVAELLDKYSQDYEMFGDNMIKLYDQVDRSYTFVEIGDDRRSVSYEGRIIGGLDELEKRL